MPRHDLKLPILQNWSCHNCSGCCRQHQIEITEEEQRRIEGQNWPSSGELPENQAIFRKVGALGRQRMALAHQADGGCVFLNEEGLCRIHAKFGEAAKPLACRIYPYAFHPAGKQVAVSVRFSCPSVVSNLGTPLAENRGELKTIASLVVPGNVRELPPPRVNAKEHVDWPDFQQFVSAIDDSLANDNQSICEKLCGTLAWLRLVESAQFGKVQGGRLIEFLDLIRQATAAEAETQTETIPPSRTGKLHFRLLIAQYARKDTAIELSRGWKGRWMLLKAALRFAQGGGFTPALQSAFREVPFSAVEEFANPRLPAEAEELFTRYFRVKVQGLHFCGRAFYDVPLVEGFQSLALMYPVVIWLARWLAVSAEASRIEVSHLEHALAIADHHHGFSPALGTRSAKSRVRQLARLGDISKLSRWYTR